MPTPTAPPELDEEELDDDEALELLDELELDDELLDDEEALLDDELLEEELDELEPPSTGTPPHAARVSASTLAESILGYGMVAIAVDL